MIAFATVLAFSIRCLFLFFGGGGRKLSSQLWFMSRSTGVKGIITATPRTTSKMTDALPKYPVSVSQRIAPFPESPLIVLGTYLPVRPLTNLQYSLQSKRVQWALRFIASNALILHKPYT